MVLVGARQIPPATVAKASTKVGGSTRNHKPGQTLVAAMKSLQDASSESIGKPPPTVLVVVDEVLVRLALSDYLRECGYNVVETSDAQEAIEVMTSDVAVDVAFSDIVMPGSLDGFGLAQWMRRERPDIKVALSSGVARSAKAAGELCEHGPMLAKPYEHADLERRIRALLASAPNRD